MSYSQDTGFSVSRVEAFSDGVLAIVITLLVLEIRPPVIQNHDGVYETWQALLTLSPKFISFFLSFLFIAVFWVNHHRFFGMFRRVDSTLLWLNNLLLLLLCFVPFPTAFLGDHPWNVIAIALFAIILMLAGVVFNLMWRHVRQFKSVEDEVSSEIFSLAIRRGLVGPIAYAIAALSASFVPLLSWLIFLIVPVFYALPLGMLHIGSIEKRKGVKE